MHKGYSRGWYINRLTGTGFRFTVLGSRIKDAIDLKTSKPWLRVHRIGVSLPSSVSSFLGYETAFFI